MPDADLDLAVRSIKACRLLNTGQVCGAADRTYVHEQVAGEFTDRFAAAMGQARYGNALEDDGVDLGPLVSARQLEAVAGRVEKAVAEGADVVVGGKPATDRPEGHFYPATVIAGCRQDMAIVREEIFGPVMPIVAFHDLDEALAYANDSIYGLASSIFTKDVDVALRACRELKFGETYINRENMENMQGFHAGWRKSGLGGADGKHGVLEYTRTHVVYLQADGVGTGG
jgi:lactaldehyde dehydrogenase/glycolaldehyde dehydrogenase